MTKLVLPYAVPAENRVRDFSKNMELAAIFYLAESEREKGEGRILKKPTEKLVFIAEACYPIWLVPWRRRTLLFDGLGITEYTLTYNIPPDIKAFDNDVKLSAKTCEAYSVALSQNANYFQNFAGKEEKNIEGLITNPEFIQDFVDYLLEVEEGEKSITTKAILSPTVHKSEISSFIQELLDLTYRLKKDIKNLGKSMKLLSMTTREKVKALREEIKEIRKKFNQKIDRIKTGVTERIRKIQGRYDEEIVRIAKRFERQLRPLHRDHVKFEKMRERLTVEIDRCEAEIKSCMLRKDEGGKIQWSQKLEMIKKKLPTLEKSIRNLDRKIGDVETVKKLDILQRRTKRDTRIEKAEKILRELEASREAKIRMNRQEIISLKDMTSSIVNQMNEMTKLKKTALNALKKLGTPRRRKDYTLVYLPFYLVCYETELKKKHILHPPSIVCSMGILTKLKGALGAKKTKSFLQCRSKAIATFLNQIVILTEENPVFEKDLDDAGIKANILRATDLRKSIKKGLEELKGEKWISESELQIFSKLL